MLYVIIKITGETLLVVEGTEAPDKYLIDFNAQCAAWRRETLGIWTDPSDPKPLDIFDVKLPRTLQDIDNYWAWEKRQDAREAARAATFPQLETYLAARGFKVLPHQVECLDAYVG